MNRQSVSALDRYHSHGAANPSFHNAMENRNGSAPTQSAGIALESLVNSVTNDTKLCTNHQLSREATAHWTDPNHAFCTSRMDTVILPCI